MPDDPTEALAAIEGEWSTGEDWEWVARKLAPAARRWADLEALVADGGRVGGRVVVETPCLLHGVLHGRVARSMLGCPGGSRRIILGEGDTDA